MNKLAMSLLNFKALMDETIDFLGSDNDDMREILYSTMFELTMRRTDGKSQAIEFSMGPEIWDLIENLTKDYVVLLNSYGQFWEDPDTERELSIAYGLDYVATETDYNQASDITYIFEVTYSKGKEIKRSLKGFYYGEPDQAATREFNGSLTAEFS